FLSRSASESRSFLRAVLARGGRIVPAFTWGRRVCRRLRIFAVGQYLWRSPSSGSQIQNGGGGSRARRTPRTSRTDRAGAHRPLPRADSKLQEAKSVLFVDALPKLANGKVDKRALRASWGMP